MVTKTLCSVGFCLADSQNDMAQGISCNSHPVFQALGVFFFILKILNSPTYSISILSTKDVHFTALMIKTQRSALPVDVGGSVPLRPELFPLQFG